MANLLLKRIKDWAKSITAFRTGDVIPVDGPSGTAKMSKDDLLARTAENALVDNLSPKFDPTKPNDEGGYAYYVGTSVFYEGKNYVFAVNHRSGPWNPSEVEQKPLSSVVDLGSVGEAVNAWLDEHPEATTTVQDGSITNAKLNETIKAAWASSSSRKGKVILNSSVPFSAQVVYPNTIYEVRYPFDLNGEEFEIPADVEFYFNGGSLNNGVLVGEFRTTSGIIRAEDIGVSYDGTNEASKFRILSGVTNDIVLTIDGDVSIGGTPIEIVASYFKLLGNGHEIKIGNACGFKVLGNLFVKDVKFSVPAGSYAIAFDLVDGEGFVDINFEYCQFEGGVRGFKSSRIIDSGKINRGINIFRMFGCSGEECRYLAGNNVFCFMQDVFYKNFIVDSCRFHNCPCQLFDTSLTNGSYADSYIQDTEKQRIGLMKNSVFIWDSGFSWTSYGVSSQAYAASIVAEAGKFIVEGCVFDNLICDVLDTAVYDAYLSCRWLEYRNNFWRNVYNKNEVCHGVADIPGTTYSCLIKSKGASGNGSYRIFEGNTYILDDTGLANNEFVPISWTGDSATGEKDLTVIKNNTFNLRSLYVNMNLPIKGSFLDFSNNKVHIQKVLSYNNSGLFNSRASYSTNYTKQLYTGNDVMVESADPTSQYKFPCFFNSAGVSEYDEVHLVKNTFKGAFDFVAGCHATDKSMRGEITDNVFELNGSGSSASYGLFVRLPKGIKIKANIVYSNFNNFLTSRTFINESIDSLYKFGDTITQIYISEFSDLVKNGESKLLNVSVYSEDCVVMSVDVLLNKDSEGVVHHKMFGINGQELEVTSSYVANYRVPGSIVTSSTKNGTMLLNLNALTGKLIRIKISTSLKTTLTYPNSATTAGISTWSSKYVGQSVYDTTLNKSIVWNGSTWINMDGSPLA